MDWKWLVPCTILAAGVACGDASNPTAAPNPTVGIVEIDPSQSALLVGDTLRLTAVVKSTEGQPMTGVAVTWSSQTTGLATVVPAFGAVVGRVTAIRAGEAVITVEAGGKTGQARIGISNPLPTLVSLEPQIMEVGGGDFTLIVRGVGFVDDSRVQWNGAVRPTTYASPTELRAAIPAADIAVIGTTQVQVMSPTPGGGVSTAMTFYVSEAPPPPTGPVAILEISADSVVLEEGEFIQLTATPRDAEGRVVTGRFVLWTSADPGVALVDYLGGVTGIRSGTASVTARVDGVSSSISARVWLDYPYDIVFGGWDGQDPSTMRFFRTDPGDPARLAVRAGPDAPSSGAVYSPDGRRVAYLLLGENGSRALMTANADGSGAVELLRSFDVGCGRLTWSPDGERLAFDCRIGDSDLDIWVADADGGNMANLTDGQPGHQEWPSWSPVLADGSTRIAYARFVSGEPQIWTMKADGSDARQITSGLDRQPAWSPDGSTIAFQRTGAAIFGDIWLVDANGGGERGLVGLYLAGPQEAPAWSPDGRFLAFSSTHETYGTGTTVSQVYTVWADGSKLARRTGGDMQSVGPAWSAR